MFNEYMWSLYKEAGGDKVIDMFRTNLSGKLSREYADNIIKLQREYIAGDWEYNNSTYDQLMSIYEDIKDVEIVPQSVDSSDLPEAIDSIFEEFISVLWEDSNTPVDYKEILYNCFTYRISEVTTCLCMDPPEIFIPYYFCATFNVLEKIMETFDISIPKLPSKNDYRGRVWYYAEICKTMYNFRMENNLDYYELCAFLYDFAPKYIGGIRSYIIDDLPEPKSAYFIGGGGNNGDESEENFPDNKVRWQCNPETKVGDIVVMYLRTPISAISSIWRAHSVGFIDPFFWYYRCTYIGSPIKVNRITLSEIKNDPVLGKMPIVNCNMQGINGIELMPSEYNHIVDISGVGVPRLEYVMEMGNEEYPNEKAVENKLIKPLLRKLGYSEDDYTQQMRIEIGNHNYALIPDFVIKPFKGGGHFSGFCVLEAKRSIRNKKELEKTKGQVRGYANQLKAQYSVVASIEGIHVMSNVDDYENDIYTATWEDLSNSDNLYRLKNLIGRK